MQSVLIIAEVGSVHDGSFGNALQLIDASAACGVDAVKFQTHLSEAETLRNAPMPPYFKGEPRFDYFKRTAFSVDQWRLLRDRCVERNVLFLSSPFSEEAVDLLEEIGMEQYKIPSGEVTNLPLLEKIARLGKPILLSSGMSSWDELDKAVEITRSQGAPVTVLQCTSDYPCPYDQVGLNVLGEMRERYGLPVGLSDHTITPYATLAAVTLGATVVERHFTFSRLMYGSDARHSLEPGELADMVKGVRAIEVMRESRVDKSTAARFNGMKEIFQKSLVAGKDLSAGTTLTRESFGIKKPGTGIPAARLGEFIGRRLKKSVSADHLFTEDEFE
jgi:N,N'-diacetyllegionaminate synthase